MGAAEGESSSAYGMSMKHVFLFILVVQNSALTLLMRYSRVLPGTRYLTSTAVVVSEALKSVVCILVFVHEQRTKATSSDLRTVSKDWKDDETAPSYSFAQFFDDVFGPRSGFVKMLIPAVAYTLQNNLQFIAASNLDAATFQVLYQCKILTTAIFAVVILRRSLSTQKWIALVILTVGVAFVQMPSTSSETKDGNRPIGLFAVIIACVLSGLAGIYFEKILKGSSSSIWLRNIQLSGASLVLAILGAFVWDGQAISAHGFFQGYNMIVIATILVQALGGLIVAMVVKHADNILKGFATSLSIILSTVISVYIFGFVVTAFFGIGSILVLLATLLYGWPEPPLPKDFDPEKEGLTSDQESLSSENESEEEKDYPATREQ